MKKETLTPFEQALLEVSLREFEDIPEEESLHHEFSPAFDAKLEAMVSKAKRNHWSKTKVAFRRALLIAAVIAALLLTAYAIPAVREIFLDFFIKDKETYYEFTYDPEAVANAPEYIETVYMPTYVPKGFEEESYICSVAGVSIIWYNDEGQFLFYRQRLMPEDPLNVTDSGVNAENATIEWISLGGGQVLRFEDEWNRGYFWATNEYRFKILCSKELSEEELTKIFNSIAVDEDALVEGAEEMLP